MTAVVKDKGSYMKHYIIIFLVNMNKFSVSCSMSYHFVRLNACHIPNFTGKDIYCHLRII